MVRLLWIALWVGTSTTLAAIRARDLGVRFDGTPGPLNAITDVTGVEVGQVSVISGKGKKGELTTARTGVTVIFPLGKKSVSGIPGAWWTLNGNGEITGVSWLEESGLLEGPIGLTNTLSVGVVRDTLADWVHKKFPGDPETGMLPFVAETDDSWLNDLYGHHVKRNHVFEAIEKATTGPVAEGSVGAGTGTVAFGFKSGIGTSSRKTPSGYSVGVLVQSNFGQRADLKILGTPVGKNLSDVLLPKENPLPRRDGSIVVVIGTDAPLLPHQVKRLVKRAALGLARTGSLGRNSSGDFFIGFSTVRPKDQENGRQLWVSIKNEAIDELFAAVVESTEESIINALVAAKDSTGINGNQYFALPHTFGSPQP
jgi:D-aminopeptidase